MTGDDPAMVAGTQLCLALKAHGVSAHLNGGHGWALVSVCRGLVVRTDGVRYSWWTGRYSAATSRKLFRYITAERPESAAESIAERWRELGGADPLARELVGAPI